MLGDNNYLEAFCDRLNRTYPYLAYVIIDGNGLSPGTRLKKLKDIRESYLK